MAWDGSTRRDRLPRNWNALRVKVLERAHYQCEYRDNGKRCINPATDCDHIIAGDNHSLDNLQALCPLHHGHKSSVEGNNARKKKYSRRIEPHPGYIGND
jgi:5-methylcytosine-specific restriction protein A